MIDGSSTVYPISQAVAEEFQSHDPHVNVLVGTSGTSGGFKQFVLGEIDINNASRRIAEAEAELCKKNGIEFLELKIALDGISIVVHPENDWCECLTVEQLKQIWEPGSKIQKWSDLNPGWPAQEIRLYGPDTDSGTFDYFTEAVCGKSGASRSDYNPSADDNVLVRGVAGDRYSLGYFGFAYYTENQHTVKAVGVSRSGDPNGCVVPSMGSVESGRYAPLSRPLFLYVNRASLRRPEVGAFLRFFLNEGQKLVAEVGYVRLGESPLAESREQLDSATNLH
jgi:phosphate transport system substrate-binding protein